MRTRKQSRRDFIRSVSASAVVSAVASARTEGSEADSPDSGGAPVKSKYQVAAYYFPNYHPDPWNKLWHGPGWTEWELMKKATPRFEGHEQPRIPLWGYEDESDPAVMEKKINAASEHGITAFIFDWYWYEEGPFLQRCLEEGFLKAKNTDKIKFAVMWANHDWSEIQPATRHRPRPVLAHAAVSPQTFREMTEHLIEKIFPHLSYWRIRDGLYFSIYELMGLVKAFGGVEETREELERFRDRVASAGLGELHLNAVVWGVRILPGENLIRDPNDLLERLGFDSATSYTWIHHQRPSSFPTTPYREIREASEKDWKRFLEKYTVPYFPNVSMGWDPSPRTIQSDVYEDLGYPHTPVLDENTPEEFRIALARCKQFLDESPLDPKVVTLNAWNEWTEGSYLEPDTVRKMAYLEAVREVFGSPT